MELISNAKKKSVHYLNHNFMIVKKRRGNKSKKKGEIKPFMKFYDIILSIKLENLFS